MQALTQRERAIVSAIGSGSPQKQVAADLGITVTTVKNHMRSIYQKTGMSNQVELCLWGIRHGLVSAE